MNKSVKSGLKWSTALRLAIRFGTYIRLAILARVLTPEQFGIFGIASLVLALIEIFTETGINIFLVQTKRKAEEFVSTAWVVSIARGFTIFFTILVFGKAIAGFFDNERVYQLLVVISLVALARGFINPSVILLQKKLNFRGDFSFRSVVLVFESVGTVVIALVTRNEISLPAGMLVGALSEVVLSLAFIKPRPRFVFEQEKLKEVLHVGKWVTLSGVSNYLSGSIDDIFVGKVIGTHSLGLYQAAYKFSTLPLTEITQVFGRVYFPLLSKVSHNKELLFSEFRKVFVLVTSASLVLGVGLFIFSDQIVYLVLGPSWIGTSPILKILAVYGVIRASVGVYYFLFNSLGRVDLVAKSLTIEFVILAILLYPLARVDGSLGVAYAVLLAGLSPIPYVIWNEKAERRVRD